ncbi:hypothetical protein [Salisaeta longa]|uniref:hypothetical protein n=1 Tax=Salisaeta longa TaxID=503170 RepID=UPI0003B40F07|nr:hypothetical protein [Salisaeta longa]
MCTLETFRKEAPAGFTFNKRPGQHAYKYVLHGKNCQLGVLFETSTDVYFEWLSEDDASVVYPPRLRYRAWPKHEVARLLNAGVWEPLQRPKTFA